MSQRSTWIKILMYCQSRHNIFFVFILKHFRFCHNSQIIVLFIIKTLHSEIKIFAALSHVAPDCDKKSQVIFSEIFEYLNIFVIWTYKICLIQWNKWERHWHEKESWLRRFWCFVMFILFNYFHGLQKATAVSLHNLRQNLFFLKIFYLFRWYWRCFH